MTALFLYGMYSKSKLRCSRRTIIPSKELLFILDSIIPKKNLNIRSLQSITTEENDNSNYYEKPFELPTIFLQAITGQFDQLSDFTGNRRLSYPLLSTVPIVFIYLDSELSLGIGCFTCVSYPLQDAAGSGRFRDKVANVPATFLSVENLTKFWLQTHSRLNIGRESSIRYCQKLVSQNKPTSSTGVGENCEVYEAFFRYINYSSFEKCELFFVNRFQLFPKPIMVFNYKDTFFSTAQYHLEFSFQFLTPNPNFLDPTPVSYMSRFKSEVWFVNLLAGCGVLIWLTLVEKNTFESAYFFRSLALFEQGYRLLRSGLRGKMLIIMWIFSALVLRQLYCSCLYSFLTTEQSPHNVPGSVDEAADRKDFDLIMPISFSSSHLIPLIAKPLKNQSQDEVATQRKFSKVALMCEGDCDSKRNVALVNQKTMFQIVPKQEPFFKRFEFWTVASSNFATLRFRRFLGTFVHSGIYDFAINRYQMWQKFKLLVALNINENLGMSNGSLFSYIFLADKCESSSRKGTPLRLKAMTGPLSMVGLQIIVAVLVFGIELSGFNTCMHRQLKIILLNFTTGKYRLKN
ncbi:unnamed protein product [Orchesella dallaii]|uniref:Ionotropic glutamate receptor C-terminal domain-containing protein n=1 Tax=Orchesella dallaii TaxID=48710 RepID=A0ABP1RHK7_9HEXA